MYLSSHCHHLSYLCDKEKERGKQDETHSFLTAHLSLRLPFSFPSIHSILLYVPFVNMHMFILCFVHVVVVIGVD